MEKASNNIYALGFLISISDILAFFIFNYISDRFGRKQLVIFGLAGSSLFFLPTLFISNITFYGLLLFISNTFTDILYSILPIYIPELFPTTIRSFASSNYYLLGRSTLFTPFIVYYCDYPQLLVCPMAIITSLIVLQLPETRGKPLMEDIEEEKEIRAELIELK